MAGADMLKAAYNSFNGGHGGSSQQTGSQVLGFLSVLALSGSVALLTLSGKHKQLWHYVFESPDSDHDARGGSEETGGGGGGGGEEDRCAEDTESWLSSNSPSSTGGCSAVKKVRFAPDVVEPLGDGQEYRRRHEIARMQAQMRATHVAQQQQQQQDVITYKRRGNSACRTAAAAMEGQQRKTLNSSRPPPPIPANRIALYNGVMQSRRQHALHCS